jgi:hypothetical protein
MINKEFILIKFLLFIFIGYQTWFSYYEINGAGNRMKLVKYNIDTHTILGVKSIISDHVPESMVMFDANDVFILGKSSNAYQLISVCYSI